MIEKNFFNDFAAFAFMQNPVATIILDEKATILKTNLAFNELSGYTETDLLGKHISLLEPDQNHNFSYDTCDRGTIHSLSYSSLGLYIQCKNDIHRLVCNKRKDIISHGTSYTILTFEDITEQKRILEHYQHLAMHDSLTGLANRVLLEDNFKKAKNRAIRNHNKMALLLCDINEFKQCNDEYGHDFGDGVLKVVAKTLKKLLRVNDTVARYGGDEFVLILEDIDHSKEIATIVSKIQAAFPLTVTESGKSCQINISIGSAYSPDEGNNFNELIQVADTNMYKEKKYFYGLS
jgi:diguanylate cyclase (GGDEF)-like protein/PAS domain S-box-containing protein